MASFFIRTLSVLLLFFSVFGSCWLEPEDTPYNSLLPPRGWRFGNRALLARANGACDADIDDPDTPDCRTLCGGTGSPCNAGSATKRGLQIEIQPETSNDTELSPREPSELRKRVFVALGQAALPAYIQAQFEGVPDPLYGSPTRLIDANAADDVNIVVQRQFANARFAIGTNGLCGCTIVTVVSDQAVYMGHFFENPSWSNAANFESMVLNFFAAGAVPVGQGVAINPLLFPAATTRVYIMTPRRTGSPNNYRLSNYRTKVPELRDQIVATLGDVPFFIYNYVAVDCNAANAQFNGQVGKALFQFDPQGVAAAQPGGAVQPGWRLLYEQHQFQSTDPLNPGAADGIPP